MARSTGTTSRRKALGRSSPSARTTGNSQFSFVREDYVALLCDAALEEIDGREVGKAAGECITVLRGLFTLDKLAASENGEMGESYEGQRWLRDARLAGGEVLNFA